MADPRVAVGIINYGDYRHLPACLDGVKQQTLSPERIILLDNRSQAEEISRIGRVYPEVEILSMRDNLGYGGGANRIIREAARDEDIMLLNPDVVLDPRHLEELVRVLRSDSGAGAVGGKLLLGDPQVACGRHGDASPRLDSTGHLIFRTRRVIDRGHGEPDTGRYDKFEEVFSVCGAAVLYRRSMLEDVRVDGEYFDEDFFAYKEDIDICWRARLFGWIALYHPGATARHHRGWRRSEYRWRVPRLRKYHSFKNQYLMMIKNELPDLLRRDGLSILGLGVCAMAYASFAEPALWKSVLDLKQYWPRARRKREIIMARRRASSDQIGHWFI